jgi:hypothetical protein
VSAPTPPTPLFDWHALGQVVLTSLALGIGLVVLFSVGVYSLSVFRRPDATVALRSANAAFISLITLVVLATGVWGFYIVVHK